MSDLLTQLREAAAEVARRGRHVHLNEAAIPEYAALLPLADPPTTQDESPPGPREQKAAFWLTLDAVNFGSGWFPTLRKRAGHSGYGTIAAGIRERFEHRGAWTPRELRAITPREIAHTLGQDPDNELMALFAHSLADLGRHVETIGGFGTVVDSAANSAVALVDTLAAWSCFADTSTYDELTLPFLKRAQITAADLHRAGVATFTDVPKLTMFADNLVPHVLRLDGVLTFEPRLIRSIENEELIAHDSPEEVEIRACALHAVELIVVERPGTTAAQIDQLLWRRGGQTRYKASPRHRSRTTAY